MVPIISFRFVANWNRDVLECKSQIRDLIFNNRDVPNIGTNNVFFENVCNSPIDA